MVLKIFIADLTLCAVSTLLFLVLLFVIYKVLKLIKFGDLTLLAMLIFLCLTLLGNYIDF